MKKLNKKKILFLKCEKTPASTVYLYNLFEKMRKLKYNVEFKYNIDKKYDFIFTMGNNPTAYKIKSNNQNSNLVIFDPKQSNLNYIKNVISSDLVVACSVEQKDNFLRLNSNIITLPAFPNLKEKKKEHRNNEKIIIGYHGNKVHLNALNKNIVYALQELSKKYKIQINLIYNINKLGKINKLPNQSQELDIKHIQWDNSTFEKELSKFDVGLVPSLLPIKNNLNDKEKFMVKDIEVNYEPFDYIIRYKCSSNNGRISSFAKKYIPVIAEPTPSNCQIINDGINGFLSYSYYSWLKNLELLISDCRLRNKLSNRLIKSVKSLETRAVQNFLTNLSSIKKNIIQKSGYDEAIKDLNSYENNKNLSKIRKIIKKTKKFIGRENGN